RKPRRAYPSVVAAFNVGNCPFQRPRDGRAAPSIDIGLAGGLESLDRREQDSGGMVNGRIDDSMFGEFARRRHQARFRLQYIRVGDLLCHGSALRWAETEITAGKRGG